MKLTAKKTMILPTYVLIYGRGGHQAQMQRLLSKGLIKETDVVNLIAITDSLKPINKIIAQSYTFNEYRDKNSYWTTVLTLPVNSLRLIFTTFSIIKNYKVKGVITTGPGIAIIPSLIFWLFRKKLVVFESWSKFYKPTITAKILYHFAGLFIIQNKSLFKIFPKAKYWGKL